MRNYFKKSLLAVSLGLLMGLTSCNSNPAEKYYKSIPQEFDAMCQRAIDEWKVPGMAVAVVKDGAVVESPRWAFP